MTITIENNVCECGNNSPNPELVDKFRNMNSREFAKYIIDGGNHQAEIDYFLTKSMHPNYVNDVLSIVTEELWFNWPKLREVRCGALRRFYPNQV